MAEDYLTDDEQLEVVKRWTVENGPWLAGGVVLAMVGIFGYRYYVAHREDIALQAAAQFGDMIASLQHNDHTKTRQIADGLITKFPASPYADQARLTLARIAVDEGKPQGAVAPLTEVMDGSKDGELKHIARLRLARLSIDQGKPDEALKLLSDAPGPFEGPYAEVRGDAFYAKKDPTQALAEYKKALAAGSENSAESAVLELKIADLGLPAAPAASNKAAH